MKTASLSPEKIHRDDVSHILASINVIWWEYRAIKENPVRFELPL